jgi:6-phosphofructokinase 1
MYQRGKSHAIVVASEGIRGGAAALARHLAGADIGFALRTTTLGHVQQGGMPSVFDRLLGTRLGAAAVQHIAAGTTGILLGLHGRAIVATPLDEVAATARTLDLSLLDLACMLAR